MFIVHRQYPARQLSDYLHSLPLVSFPIGPISCSVHRFRYARYRLPSIKTETI